MLCKLKKKLFVFRIAKEYHQDFSLLHIIYSLYITFFGEKWLTLSVRAFTLLSFLPLGNALCSFLCSSFFFLKLGIGTLWFLTLWITLLFIVLIFSSSLLAEVLIQFYHGNS